ncbi:MAG: RHS repeat domain-containing protein [Polyangiaceae bacterium]
MNVGVSLQDIPVGYDPPVGPSVKFKLYYSQRDQQQPTTGFPYTNFGPQWTTTWLSYVTDLAAGTKCQTGIYGGTLGVEQQGDADLYRQGGGEECFVTGSNQRGAYSGTTLSRCTVSAPCAINGQNVTSGFLRTSQDGSTQGFTQPMGNQWFMTSVSDAWGNTVTIRYDQTMRIASLTDLLNQVTHVCYADTLSQCTSGIPDAGDPLPLPPTIEPTPDGGSPADGSAGDVPNTAVVAVRDPFNRVAYFGYDPLGRLTTIQDVVGIQSHYTYYTASGSPNGSLDTVASLNTTPYNATTYFAYSKDANETSPYWQRYVQVANSYNSNTTRVEYCDAPPYVPDDLQGETNAVPLGMHETNPGCNGYCLSHRNTFVWDPNQYQKATATYLGEPGVFVDQQQTYSTQAWVYNSAKIIHWLHAANSVSSANWMSRVIESVRPAGYAQDGSGSTTENRIWYNYDGQANNPSPYYYSMAGSSNQPTAVGRVLADGTTILWTYQYNAAGNVTQIVDPSGRTTQYDYYPNNIDVLDVKNVTPGHNDTLVQYPVYAPSPYSKVSHKPALIIGANGQQTSITYNNYGQIATIRDPITTWTYNYPTSPPSPYLQSIQGPNGQVAAFTYDSDGRTYTGTNANGMAVQYQYDAADRPTLLTFPDGTTIKNTYTLSGNPTLDLQSVTDRMGHVTTYTYDPDRELKVVATPILSTTSTYWGNGRLKTFQTPSGTTTFNLDWGGRPSQTSYPDGTTSTSVSYDRAGRLQTFTNARGQKTTYTLNVDGTAQSVSNNGPSVPTTYYNYDPAYPRMTTWSTGQACQLVNGVCQFTGGANPPHEVRTFYPVGVLGANQIASTATTMVDATNASHVTTDTVTYQYDALDRVIYRQITDGFGNQLQPQRTGFDPGGRVAGILNALDNFSYNYPAGAATLPLSMFANHGPNLEAAYYGPTGNNLLQSMTYYAGTGGALATYAYTYNPNGQAVSFTETYGTALTKSSHYQTPVTTNYNYDDGGEVTGEQGNIQVTYGYDAGNLTSFATPSVQTFAFNSDDELTSASPPLSASYDPDGNMTGYGASFWTGASVSTLTWDGLSRLLTVKSGTAESDFTYDGLGHLVQVVNKQSGAITANHLYLWCGKERCAQHDNTIVDAPDGGTCSDAAGATCVSMVDKQYFDQGTVPSGGTAQYYIRDRLGTVHFLVSETAQTPTTFAQYEYDAFGFRIPGVNAGSGPDSDFGYAGYFQDLPSGVNLTRHRAYQPGLARWLSRDPIGLAGGASVLYEYSGNDPTDLTDPSGLAGTLSCDFGPFNYDENGNWSINILPTFGCSKTYCLPIPCKDPKAPSCSAGVKDAISVSATPQASFPQLCNVCFTIGWGWGTPFNVSIPATQQQ